MASSVVRRGNWVWGGVLFVLALVWCVVFVLTRSGDSLTTDEPLISEDYTDVERILIQRGQHDKDEQRVEIVRDDLTQRWSLVAPDDERAERGYLRANKQYVEALLDALELASVGVVVEENAASPLDYPEYWLHPADGITVTVTYAGYVDQIFVIGKPISDVRSFVYDAQRQQVLHVDIPRSVTDRLSWESDIYTEGTSSEDADNQE